MKKITIKSDICNMGQLEKKKFRHKIRFILFDYNYKKQSNV